MRQRIDMTKNKKRTTKGETLVETLMSLIIATLAFLMLPGAIIASARVNKTVGDISLYGGDVKDMTDTAAAPTGENAGTVQISFDSGMHNSHTVNVKLYGTDVNGLYEFELSE